MREPLICNNAKSRSPLIGKRADFKRQRNGGVATFAVVDNAVGQSDVQRFGSVHWPAREHHVKRARKPNQLRQPHSAAVDQRHTPAQRLSVDGAASLSAHPHRSSPAPTKDTEHGRALDNAQVAPERELEPARHSVAGDGRNPRLARLRARAAHRTVAVRHRQQRVVKRLEVGAGAERRVRRRAQYAAERALA